MINIINDSLVAEIIETIQPTPKLISRICDYYRHCELIGCKCILNPCSSVGEVADIAAKLVEIPVFKIDYPMSKQAVELGRRIAIVATAVSTLGPSKRLFEQTSLELNKKTEINMFYCEGAHPALIKENNQELHDEIVISNIHEAVKSNDVIVLAQGSMHHLLSKLTDIEKPFLTSLESGVSQIKDFLCL
jgi:Asp/Glu/hydantoin racemase